MPGLAGMGILRKMCSPQSGTQGDVFLRFSDLRMLQYRGRSAPSKLRQYAAALGCVIVEEGGRTSSCHTGGLVYSSLSMPGVQGDHAVLSMPGGFLMATRVQGKAHEQINRLRHCRLGTPVDAVEQKSGPASCCFSNQRLTNRRPSGRAVQ